VQSNNYWSSSAFEGHPSSAWLVTLNAGAVFSAIKDDTWFVWPVRGGR
jgi:hypothetical protein